MQDFAYLKSLLNDSILWLVRALRVSLPQTRCESLGDPAHSIQPLPFTEKRDQASTPGAASLTQQEGWDDAGTQEGAWSVEGSGDLNLSLFGERFLAEPSLGAGVGLSPGQGAAAGCMCCRVPPPLTSTSARSSARCRQHARQPRRCPSSCGGGAGSWPASWRMRGCSPRASRAATTSWRRGRRSKAGGSACEGWGC